MPLLSGCGAGALPQQRPPFEPTLLTIRPDAAAGPDYIARERIDSADDVDYFQLVLRASFNTVVVMTRGDTDTAGRVETADRVPVTADCEGKAWNAVPPCAWGNDDDIVTPNAMRTPEYNKMASSHNFLWEGSLDAGTYFIRVTGENSATGAYELIVETNNRDCPYYYLEHPGCAD